MNNEPNAKTTQPPGALVREYVRTGFTADANTVRRYTQAADLLDAYFGRDMSAADLSMEDVAAWLQWMEDRGGWLPRMGASRKPGRPAQLVATVRKAFEWARRNGQVEGNVFAQHLAPAFDASRRSRAEHRRRVEIDVAERLATDPELAQQIRNGLDTRSRVKAAEQEWLETHGDEMASAEIVPSWHRQNAAERMAEFGITEQWLADLGKYTTRHGFRREPDQVPSLDDLYDVAISSEWAAAFVLAGVGGLTWEEMQHLKWWDVRWFEGCICVRGSADSDEGDGSTTQVVEGRLVKKGTRMVPLFEDLRVVLASHFDSGHAEEVFVLSTLRVAARSGRGEADLAVMLHAAGCTEGSHDLDAVLLDLRDAALDRLIVSLPSGALRRRAQGSNQDAATGWQWHEGMAPLSVLSGLDGPTRSIPSLLARYIETHGGLPDGYEARGVRLPDDYWES